MTESSSSNQVGMKQNAVSIRLDIFQHLGFRNLTRGETDYRTVLIVVTLTSIRDIPAVGIFQIKSVHAVVDLEMFRPPRRLRQIDYTY